MPFNSISHKHSELLSYLCRVLKSSPLARADQKRSVSRRHYWRHFPKGSSASRLVQAAPRPSAPPSPSGSDLVHFHTRAAGWKQQQVIHKHWAALRQEAAELLSSPWQMILSSITSSSNQAGVKEDAALTSKSSLSPNRLQGALGEAPPPHCVTAIQSLCPENSSVYIQAGGWTR